MLKQLNYGVKVMVRLYGQEIMNISTVSATGIPKIRPL